MSAFLFIQAFLELRGDIEPLDIAEWLMIASLVIKIFLMKNAKKKEHDEEHDSKADKTEVDKDFKKVEVELKDKVSRPEFKAHEKDNEKQHKDIMYVRGRVDDIHKELMELNKGK
jgi:hypothetical protein